MYAAANQACVISPFILSGAMSPVTAAGTLALFFFPDVPLALARQILGG